MKHAAAHTLYDALDAVTQMATAPLARDDNQASVVHPSAQSLGRHADVTETGGRGVRAGGLEVDGVSIGNPADTLAAGPPAKLIALPSPSLRTLFGLSASHSIGQMRAAGAQHSEDEFAVSLDGIGGALQFLLSRGEIQQRL